MPESGSRSPNITAKLCRIITQSQSTNGKLEDVVKKIDMLIVIELAKCGLTRKEVADILKVSEDTIERMLPFGKIKQNLAKE